MATEPAVPFDVKAIAAYTARNTTEVSLEVGKVYHVQQTDGKGLWWQTKSDITGTIGWFPASYTEVLQSQPAPQPVVQQQVYAQPAAQQPQYQSQPQPQPQAQVAPAAATMSQSTTPNEVPQPSRPLAKEKPDKARGDSPVFVKLQVIEAKGLRGEASKTNPTAYILRHRIMEDRSAPLFSTQPVKKSIAPRWNEQFQLNVWDAELEVVCVRICNGKSVQTKGPKFLGEISFALRSAARDFDHPKGKLKWFPLSAGKSGEKCTGECLIYIEFFDTREHHGPKDFKHESHVGWTKEGGFDINNIPAEWKKIFKQVGIRRADLENNPELAGQVLDIMNKAESESPAGFQASGLSQNYQQPPQPPVAPQAYQTPAVAQAPPPPVYGGGSTTPKAPAPPPAPTPVAAAPPPPPPPVASATVSSTSDSGSSGGGMSDLALALQNKQLRKVAAAPEKPAAASTDGNPLSNALIAALKQHRKDIEGHDEDTVKGDDDDDWG